MPIYEYECSNCHHKFDLIQKIHDAPATQCPQCFQDTAVRLVSAAGFQLKGNGWYVTDFKNKGTQPVQANKDKDKSATGDKKPEVKTDSSSKGEKD
ncbi:Type I antifreeze protein [Legionella busanensis]|uniref:Type I antifreeze protein n=1 Tax=Legionella busanensis TaxID=190655 RepID=A0A378JJY1_9GAMM|nr:zinc ribbon domain-containing protein [Legionella busanensis]STX51377.1 Type I antifreeze protein [Legionella busanensis]